jgi:hypothetical protein
MRTTNRDELPKASHPPSTSTIAINALAPPEFPFKRLSSLPSLSYALENLIISLGTIITGLADCILTLYVWIPLGLARSLIQLLRAITSQKQQQQQQAHPSSSDHHHPTSASTTTPRVIILSGASSGIGASLVQTYAGPNSILVLLARNPARLNQIAKVARNAGCRAVETHSIDYSHDGAEQAIKLLITAAHQKYGSIDLVLSVAGTVTFTDDDPRGPQQWGQNVRRSSCSSIYSNLIG